MCSLLLFVIAAAAATIATATYHVPFVAISPFTISQIIRNFNFVLCVARTQRRNEYLTAYIITIVLNASFSEIITADYWLGLDFSEFFALYS